MLVWMTGFLPDRDLAFSEEYSVPEDIQDFKYDIFGDSWGMNDAVSEKD